MARKEASESPHTLDKQDEAPDADIQPTDPVTHGTVCQVYSIEDTYDIAPAMPTMTQTELSTSQCGQALARCAVDNEAGLVDASSFSLTPKKPMYIVLDGASLPVQSVDDVDNYLSSLSESFSDESTELQSDFVTATRMDMADCNETAIKELETLIMAQCKDLTLESPDDAWNAFAQAICDKCQSMIEPQKPEPGYLGAFYSYIWGTQESEAVHPSFHLIASVAHVLNGFPDYNTALSTQFEQQHQENIYPFRRKVIACMNVVLKHLDLENRFKTAVRQYAKPIQISIENGRDTTNQVSNSEITNIVEKISGAISHQVSAEQKKEGNLVAYGNMQLPRQFLEKDLGRMHYQFHIEDGKTIELPVNYEGTLDEKQTRAFNALCALTGNREEVIRQICFYATQDAHIGLLRAIEFNFIWRVYGPGFSFSGSDAIIKLSKDSATGNIVITYEFMRQPVSLLTHNFGNIVTMENLREGWDKSLVRCEISIMIDPSDANKPPTYLPLHAEIDLP
ncbi:hypothetical protein GCM10023116_16530 [Kistimonas scapharcae]|uniref:Uncharacterized protein n=2 Tax=Kistimonas scapharcae TaxID=1036133 RepID=A0ABP8V1U2_9GAMM